MPDQTLIFWIILWAVSFLAFLSPLCWTKKRREMWWKVLTCNWQAEEPRSSASLPSVTNDVEGLFHYRLSRSQEDEIRESFLLEKLRMYTLEITESDIMRQEGSEDSTQVTSVDSGEHPGDDEGQTSSAEQDGLVLDANEDGDIETGATESRARTDSTGNLTGSDSGDEAMDEFGFEDCDNEFVVIPVAGECRHELLPETISRSQRQVPNGCAICLSAFHPKDKVTWSSNPGCNHVFHHSCILDWLQASGRKDLRRQRRGRNGGENPIINYAVDPVKCIVTFPTLCPCCRQDFILKSDDDDMHEEKGPDANSGQLSVGSTSESELTSAVTLSSSEEGVTLQSSSAPEVEVPTIAAEMPNPGSSEQLTALEV